MRQVFEKERRRCTGKNKQRRLCEIIVGTSIIRSAAASFFFFVVLAHPLSFFLSLFSLWLTHTLKIVIAREEWKKRRYFSRCYGKEIFLTSTAIKRRMKIYFHC
jgi:uncharacterized paraquat-inducible protein A